jgi:ATP-dependent DNA ligase
MEAAQVAEPPAGPEWQYEPKWDGFRCLAFRTGDDVYLQSKSGKPLARYFPDIADALRSLRASRFVLDGEIVIPVSGRLSFDDLLMRIHPAQSRVRTLAEAHPAMLVLFDLLVDPSGKSLAQEPLSFRRPALESFARRFLARNRSIRLSPATTSLARAQRWFRAAGGNLDGIIAKRLDLPYRSGERDGMVKIKHHRTADCVVGGFRYAAAARVVGSLLLGLYDARGRLNHVGFTSGLSIAERARVTALLEPLRAPSSFTGRSPGGPSRWSTRESDEWQAVRPRPVVEVQYDHFTGGRFRHGTRLLRWRPDKRPRDCTEDQVRLGSGSTLDLLTTRP